ncbi:CrfX protein [Halopseudomonas phragmitis]|uniref:CrfX protein n=2 Tax=Pseudomonadaceae TaxID=135621 RepID=A0A1V0B7A2_9GAMM|nr:MULTISPECIES: hypothetical protein [Pseudomonadaceae]AQZ95816.1 hypothetical protein BVH74_14110 [Halopseudomonas phragmitis]RHW21465.1 CrfX protein [Pseudomonas jilinensis]
MEDPFERRVRELMRQASEQQSESTDDQRLERVLHKAHIHGGIFDLLNLFTRWGWVLSEGGARGLRHIKPVRREHDENSSIDPH